MKILLSRKESSTNDVTHTSLCHSTHIVFFCLFNSNTTCCCLETKKKILFHYIVLVCWTTVCTATASTTIETCSSHGIYTQRVRSQLMSHYYCENLKVVVFCFCRLHNYNNKSNTNFFLSLSKWRSHIAQVVRTTTTRKKNISKSFFSRCCSNYLRIHSCCCRHIYNGNNSTRSPNHLKKTWDTVLTGVAHKWCHTMTHFFTTTTTTWSCNFFHTDLIIWSYIRHYFNHLNNY